MNPGSMSQGSSNWSGSRQGSRPPAWGASTFQATSGSTAPSSTSNAMPEVQMLMNQVRKLQEKVQELSQGSNATGTSASGDFGQFQPSDQRILLVSNIPNSVASCDALFFMFDRFGVVERIKILHNKRSAALVQMQTVEMAEHAVNEQHVLNRIGADIYVNFSNKVTEIRLPSEKGLPEDGLSKDFTYPNPSQGAYFGQGPFSGNGPPMRQSQLPPVGEANSQCILVSNLPEEMANPDSISNLFGHYGDVHKVKILHNKKDCALIQMAKPHHAAQCRQYLDQVKVGGNTICVSFSRIQGIRMPTDIGMEDEATKDFTNIRGVHRFRNHNMAARLIKNLCSPTMTLHVANLPEDFKSDDLQQYLVEKGFTVKEVQECGKDGSNMALVIMDSIDEAIRTLAKCHNVTPEGFQTKNNSGLCFSFSGRKLNVE